MQVIVYSKNIVKKIILHIPIAGKLIKKRYKKINNEKQQKNYANNMNKLIQKYGNKPPMFSAIEIETLNRCNGVCNFCPVNKKDDIREYKMMDEQLFEKIIDELQRINYNGRLALFSNNEPFLDKRIIEFAKQARGKLPNAFIYIITNTTLLSLDMFKAVIPYLDEIVLNTYSYKSALNPETQKIMEYCKNYPDIEKKVKTKLTKIDAIRYTRGGQAPNNKRAKTLPISCHLPFKQIVVRPDGKVSLCCNDAYGRHTLGDINLQSLADVWHSDKYIEIRNNLIKGRAYIDLCKYCDTIHNAIVNYWHPVDESLI